jgi:hypothetical protein
LLAHRSAHATAALSLQAALNVSSVRSRRACWADSGASWMTIVCFME